MVKPPVVLDAPVASEDPDTGEVLLMLHRSSSHHQGPLPSPQQLAEYDQAVPGLSDEIVSAWKEETAHRREMEMRLVGMDEAVVSNEGWVSKAGVVTGAIIGLAGLGTAVALAALNAPWGATVVGGSTLVGLVSVFIYGTRAQQTPRDDSQPTPSESSLTTSSSETSAAGASVHPRKKKKRKKRR